MNLFSKLLLVVIAALIGSIGWMNYKNGSLNKQVTVLQTQVKERDDKIATYEHQVSQLKTEMQVNAALVEEYKRANEQQQVENQALEEANKVTERKLVFALSQENWSDQKVPAGIVGSWAPAE